MKLTYIYSKLGLLTTLITGTILIASFNSIAMADPAAHCGHQQMTQEQIQQHMQERMKTRMDTLAQRLEIKASQQSVWEGFAKSIETLPEQNAKQPADDADAATIARYHADRAAKMASKLAKVADATAKLEAALTPDQRKVLDQTAHLFLHHRQGAGFGH
ncbi:MAG TPA: Spy/CpxP family protein refolding chaperone, partial [Gallionella sp.]|nr:Spy/CpxP family protein refolding chaperone [Gallionella sp.]